jgi:hypothetical protein
MMKVIASNIYLVIQLMLNSEIGKDGVLKILKDFMIKIKILDSTKNLFNLLLIL